MQQQETTLKQLISKRNDPDLDAATIVLSDPLPEPRETDLPALQTALSTAIANRPELKEAANNLENQNIAIKYAQNNLLPSMRRFRIVAPNSASKGNTITTARRETRSTNSGQRRHSAPWANRLEGHFPEAAYGTSFTTSIRNRSAQADNIRAQLERNQQEISQQNTKNQTQLASRSNRVWV